MATGRRWHQLDGLAYHNTADVEDIEHTESTLLAQYKGDSVGLCHAWKINNNKRKQAFANAKIKQTMSEKEIGKEAHETSQCSLFLNLDKKIVRILPFCATEQK